MGRSLPSGPSGGTLSVHCPECGQRVERRIPSSEIVHSVAKRKAARLVLRLVRSIETVHDCGEDEAARP